ncbi:carbohydrate-binding protein [Crossiella sp. CA-258035]|uniref:carbohydrate-binding protein n=1 Tax=Crossiella sp. CA-258035 TaxID=2981138 RepID=UPI0024BBFE90|nr:carbohydrate-binding protein [Crossiella sp. CA-258035]WHT23680.1 carbohydrate-binding protein [Crossiella sp. CA-258035]
MGAAYYDEQRGTDVQRCTDAGCGRNVGWIAAGDHLGYADVDFGATAPRTVTARLASGASTTGTLEFRLGSPAGPVVATVSAASTGGWQSWASRGATVSGSATGVQRLHVVAAGGGGANFANLNWFQFAR